MTKINKIYEKLCAIEKRMDERDKREQLGSHNLVITLLEDHAQKCQDFQGFICEENRYELRADAKWYEPTLTTKCSCGDETATVVATENPPIQILKKYIEELNQKYKRPPIQKPNIKNITDRIEL